MRGFYSNISATPSCRAAGRRWRRPPAASPGRAAEAAGPASAPSGCENLRPRAARASWRHLPMLFSQETPAGRHRPDGRRALNFKMHVHTPRRFAVITANLPGVRPGAPPDPCGPLLTFDDRRNRLTGAAMEAAMPARLRCSLFDGRHQVLAPFRANRCCGVCGRQIYQWDNPTLEAFADALRQRSSADVCAVPDGAALRRGKDEEGS
jgi:hypothetical protein